MYYLLCLSILQSVAGSRYSLDARRRPAIHHLDAVIQLRGGGEPSDSMLQAAYSCNSLYSSVLADAMTQVSALRKSVSMGEPIPTFGSDADALISDAISKFNSAIPKAQPEILSIYEEKADELKTTLANSLEPIFTRQVSLLKEGALERFKDGIIGDADGASAAAKAEAAFVRDATASVPASMAWDFKAERASLSSLIAALNSQAKKAAAIKIQSAQQMQTAMSYLQMQQQQMQAIQAQYTGGQGGKWNLGAAYRPPDTDINLSASYNQGRANIQISLMPEEGANLLGPNGFTNGVGPANLGMSFNIHI